MKWNISTNYTIYSLKETTDLYTLRTKQGSLVDRFRDALESIMSSSHHQQQHTDEDGDDCRACTSRQKKVEQMLAQMHSKKMPSRLSSSSGAKPPQMPGYPGSSFPPQTKASPEMKSKRAPYEPFDCPADKDELGRSTWTFLHTMAAYFPKRPSPEQQKGMSDLLSNFSVFYPCSPCASHMRDYLQRHPAKADSREALSLWMCNFHNEVNEILDKPKFDCARVMERWKTGPPDGSCD